MSAAIIRQLFEVAVAAVTDSTVIDTQWENVTFNPADSKPYQEVFLMFAKPQNPTVSVGFHRELGILQINLHYPLGDGSKNADARADVLLAAFARGWTMQSGKITLTVSGSPYLSPAQVDGNRWALPVKIPFFANVFE